MLDLFSVQAVKIIEDAKEIANNYKSELVGTEHLLIAMYETKDSICRFLLQEQKIMIEDINNILNRMVIIHKVEHPDVTFTNKFQEIILKAKELAIKVNSDYVFDEHIFYTILDDKESMAYEILTILKLNTENMKEDVAEIFNFFEYPKEDISPYSFLIKLTNQHRLHPFVKRKDYLERMVYILAKKQKNNPLLIGNAGVGKTAIVEGLADYLKDETIYQLDLGGVVAGTKYRGELEEKLIKAMDYIKQRKAIVFIDEIHNIVGAGSNDGSLDIANILKPYLTRSDLRMIGATTLDEYYRFIEKDKALMRRFQNIFIEEPNALETYNIINQIKGSYEEYHHVKYSKKMLWDIINKCDIYLPNRTFPDKAIDVIDEVGSRAAQKSLYYIDNLVDQVITDMNGISPKKISEIVQMKLNYPQLIPYYIRFIKRIEPIKNIVSIAVNNDFIINPLINDLEKVFAFKKEMYLEIDLENYQNPESLSNLIGSNKGYVGYETGGLLTEHIIKYPFALVFFKNTNITNNMIINFLEKILKKEFMYDNKNRKISLSNVIFIMDKNNTFQSKVGFISTENCSRLPLCDVFLDTINCNLLSPKILKLINQYKMTFDKKITKEEITRQIYEKIYLIEKNK